MIHSVVDRGVRDAMVNMLRLRGKPLQLRVISPWVSEIEFPDGETLTRKIRNLRVQREAEISLVINPDIRFKEDQLETLHQLEELGVRLHFKHNLHSKIVLAISKKEKYVLVSSANLTPTGMNIQNEAGVFAINDAFDIFDKLFKYSNRLLDESDKRISLEDLKISKKDMEESSIGRMV